MGRHSERHRVVSYFDLMSPAARSEHRARVSKQNARAKLTDTVERRRVSGTHQEDFKPQPFRQPQNFEVGSNGQIIFKSEINSPDQ